MASCAFCPSVKLKRLSQDDRNHAEEMARVRRAAARLGVAGR